MEFIQFDTGGVNVELGRYSDEFSAWRQSGHVRHPLPKPHRHHSLEVVFVLDGDVDYQTPEGMYGIPQHRLILFGAAIPHQPVIRSKTADYFSVHVPFPLVLRWGLPEHVYQWIMDGCILVDTSEGMFEADAVYFEAWHRNYVEHVPPNMKLLAMELQCRLKRGSPHFQRLELRSGGDAIDESLGRHDQVARMADYMHLYYQDAITIVHVAEHVGLHPKSASRLFSQKCGICPKQYILMLRIYHAQLLLATTDLRVSEIALDSGFRTVGAFHAAFRKACGCAPQEYRGR